MSVQPPPRGRLRVYLGMAPGVGKTYAMLEEAHRLRARGVAVVAGFVETYGRPGTETLLGGLEVIPRRRVAYRRVTVEEMDTHAILRRAPAIVLVDELAHTNAPGSTREKRWEDIEAIRDAGIDVISTCNVQHLDSVADAVERMVGVAVHERVPDEVLRGADEIELVDLSPARLRRRMSRGEVYPPERTALALEKFFTEPNLVALRDLALHFVTGQVDADLQDRLSGAVVVGAPTTDARVMVVVDGAETSRRVFRRATMLADRLRAPLLVLAVAAPSPASDRATETVDEIVADATDAGTEVLRAAAGDPAAEIARVARERLVTHVVLAQPRRGRLARLSGDSLLDRLVRLAPDLEVSLVGPGPPADARRATF
ncbi:MAG TPA: universal stress protein [Candidatus Limnocylindrales bacterium]